MNHHTRTKRDANHGAITEHLRKHGCDVIDMAAVGGGVPDLLVKRGDVTAFVEVKVRWRFTLEQIRWLSMRSFNVIIADTPEDALYRLRTRRFITQAQRDRLAAMVAIEPKPLYQAGEVREILGC